MNRVRCLATLSSSALLERRLPLRGFAQRALRHALSAACMLWAGVGIGLSGPLAHGAGLQAGAARMDITPAEPVMLAGYASRKDLSQGVHDPLSARAIAFEQEGQRLALVSIDNLGFYNQTADLFRKAILESSGLKPSELFLCAIHTHSAPALTLNIEKGHSNNVAYTRTLQARLLDLVRKSLAQMAPAEIGVGSGSSPVGVNRREVVQDDTGKTKIVLGRNPFVVTDREVQVLKVARPGGKALAAVLFAYATHSTSLGPQNYLVSGDIHGLAEQFLERYLEAEAVALGLAGASGNIDPWVRVLPEFRSNKGWVPEPVLMGTMLGEEVARVLERIKSAVSHCPIKTVFKTVELPGKPGGSAAAEPKVPFNLSVGCVGDLAFVGFGGEVFNEIGKAVKVASPFRTTFIITHCNGAAGYVPTRSSYAEGGYEVESSPFAPGADEQLIDATLQTLRELK